MSRREKTGIDIILHDFDAEAGAGARARHEPKPPHDAAAAAAGHIFSGYLEGPIPEAAG